jgi:hypothetical protein
MFYISNKIIFSTLEVKARHKDKTVKCFIFVHLSFILLRNLNSRAYLFLLGWVVEATNMNLTDKKDKRNQDDAGKRNVK